MNEKTDPATRSPTPGTKGTNQKWQLILLVVLVAFGSCALLIPVAGIGTAIAVPAFMKYKRRAKALEAKTNLIPLRSALMRRCEERGNFDLPTGAGPVPPTATLDPIRGDFAADPGFRELGFDPGEPVRFSYRIENKSAETLEVIASADTDGNGTAWEFVMHCGVETSDRCACGELDEIEERNPGE